MALGRPTPAAQMREELARLRRRGLPFDLAWKRALERVKWPEEKTARDEWKVELARSKRIWRAAYQREGSSPRGLNGLTNLFFTEASEHFPTEVLA